MSTQKRTVILLGLLMCLLVFWVGQTLLEKRDKSAMQARQMAARAAKVAALADELKAAPRTSVHSQQKKTLFALVNYEVKRLGLSRHLEAVRPGQSDKDGRRESLLEFRLSGMYLRGILDWMHAVENMNGVRVLRMQMSRTGAGLLDLDMAIARTEDAS